MKIEIKKIPGKFDELNPDFRVTLGGVTMNLSYEELKELKILSNKVLFISSFIIMSFTSWLSNTCSFIISISIFSEPPICKEKIICVIFILKPRFSHI